MKTSHSCSRSRSYLDLQEKIGSVQHCGAVQVIQVDNTGDHDASTGGSDRQIEMQKVRAHSTNGRFIFYFSLMFR